MQVPPEQEEEEHQGPAETAPPLTPPLVQPNAPDDSGKGHRSREDNRTLNQQSFLQILREGGQGGAMTGLADSRWAVAEPEPAIGPGGDANATSTTPEVLLESSATADGTPIDDHSKMARDEPVQPDAIHRPVSGVEYDVFAQDSPRFTKRMNWRGRNLLISLPTFDYELLGFVHPLTADQVQHRLTAFLDAGHSIEGFDLPSDGIDRPIFPDDDDYKAEIRQQQRPVVAFPDSQKWAAYKDQLLEQKLAALGVGTAGPAPSPQQAQYPALPFSPPLSAGPLSTRPGSIRAHSHSMSVVSPLSPAHANGGFGHTHRHSTFSGPASGIAMQLQQQQQLSQHRLMPLQSVPLHGEPQSRGNSPAQLTTLRIEHGSLQHHGPSSPLRHQSTLQSPQQDYSRGLAEDQWRRQQQSQSPSVQLPQTLSAVGAYGSNVQRTPVLPEVLEEDEDTGVMTQPHNSSGNATAIAEPAPRGKGHEGHPSISDGLEGVIRDAETRREVIENTKLSVPSNSGATLANGDNSRTDTSTTPLMAASKNLGHKKTASRFNVAAPVFEFRPAATAAATSGFAAPIPTTSVPIYDHSRHRSIGSLNVAAPVFMPSTLPKSDFSFSTQRPVLPAPQTTAQHDSDRASTSNRPSIFGDIKIAVEDVVKPARRSKAVAIVRPEMLEAEDEEFEDEEGRIAQSEDRLKRMKRGGVDGDDVPRFADMGAEREVGMKATEEVENHLVRAPSVNMSFGRDEDRALGNHSTPTSPDVSSAVAKPFSAGARSVAWSGSLVDDKENIDPSEDITDGEAQDQASDSTTTEARPVLVSRRSSGVSSYPSTSKRSSLASISETDHHPNAMIEYLPSQRIADVEQPEPSFDEIDAVMRQLNDERPDPSPRAVQPASPLPADRFFDDQPMLGVTYLGDWTQSAARSPQFDRRVDLPRDAEYDSSFGAHERLESNEPAPSDHAGVHRLNHATDVPLSDWSGVLSSCEEDKLQQRSYFFDDRIDSLIGQAVERRLQPLKESLRSISGSLGKGTRSTEPVTMRSLSTVESDADDEDEPASQRYRPGSRGKDRRADEIRSAVLEALRDQQAGGSLSELQSAIFELRNLVERTAGATLDAQDVRHAVETALRHQSEARDPSSADRGAHTRELSELEGRYNETLAGALEEASQRHAVEEREAETKRMLRLAEEELSILRETNKDEEGRAHAEQTERDELLDRVAKAEDVQRENEDRIRGLEAENEAMQETLEEYRMSSSKWRHDIDDARKEGEERENTIVGLERQADEAREASAAMRRRLERLHADMATAAGQLASEKTGWKEREKQYQKRCAELETFRIASIEERKMLDDDVASLRADAGQTEAVAKANAALVFKLQAELAEQRSLVEGFEAGLLAARDSHECEIREASLALASGLEGAVRQATLVRAELEGDLLKVRSELEHAKGEFGATEEAHRRNIRALEQATAEAVQIASERGTAAVAEAHHKHATELQDLIAQHARTLDHAVEDGQRSERFLHERLELSEAKKQHLQDRIVLMEERLAIANSAAQAAAANAQSKVSLHADLGKVSPQALRESILVLQEQLQERETRIESLQGQVDFDGPAKLKERDVEISWLRELLAVRNDELTELIGTLSQPTFDRDAVRDTAIRIRANLQMERQEKERPQFLPGQALASLSNFATPKAAQLFKKWRTTMESSSLKSTVPMPSTSRTSSTPVRVRNHTTKAPVYQVGLMTPPASNLRNTPSPELSSTLPQRRPDTHPSISFQQPGELPSSPSEAPATPLFGQQHYDEDAEDSKVHMHSFEDDDLDVHDSQPPAFRESIPLAA